MKKWQLDSVPRSWERIPIFCVVAMKLAYCPCHISRDLQQKCAAFSPNRRDAFSPNRRGDAFSPNRRESICAAPYLNISRGVYKATSGQSVFQLSVCICHFAFYLLLVHSSLLFRLSLFTHKMPSTANNYGIGERFFNFPYFDA